MSNLRNVILVNQDLKSDKRIEENAVFFLFLGASDCCCPVVHSVRPLGSAAPKFMSLVFTLHKNRKYKSTSVNNQDNHRLKIPA